ncbi:hypothetical protein KC347_g18 [Hortaea werneckii]|nr:hypothetical protein KC347_g18 [Hortaea werneckii]
MFGRILHLYADRPLRTRMSCCGRIEYAKRSQLPLFVQVSATITSALTMRRITRYLPQLYSKFICMTESRGLLGGLSGGLASGPHGRCCGRPRNVRSSVHPDTSGLSQVAARQHVVPVASYDHLVEH